MSGCHMEWWQWRGHMCLITHSPVRLFPWRREAFQDRVEVTKAFWSLGSEMAQHHLCVFFWLKQKTKTTTKPKNQSRFQVWGNRLSIYLLTERATQSVAVQRTWLQGGMGSCRQFCNWSSTVCIPVTTVHSPPTTITTSAGPTEGWH